MKSFETQTYGKWILAGEHAVLRGSPALVFPLKSRSLSFRYLENKKGLEFSFSGTHGNEFEILLMGLIDKAAQMLGRQRNELDGVVFFESSIPVGAGLGASAAVSVAVARWLANLGWIQTDKVFEFSVKLENLFHGESSGVDVAVAFSGEALRFVRGEQKQTFVSQWKPPLYISYTGQRGPTLECVNKVKAIIEKNPELGNRLDRQMQDAETLCEVALSSMEDDRVRKLQQGMALAGDCFVKWGLTSGAPQAHMTRLLEAGALAVKPTGSGGGGYVLSLWPQEPPKNLGVEFLSCF